MTRVVRVRMINMKTEKKTGKNWRNGQHQMMIMMMRMLCLG